MSASPTAPMRQWSIEEWEAWIDACLHGRNPVTGRRTAPDDPLLAVRRALREGLGSAARLNHLAAVVNRLRQSARSPEREFDLAALVGHLAATATAFEREQPEAEGIEDTLLDLHARGRLALLPLRALAALNRPDDDGFWLHIATDDVDPLLAIEVLARRRSPLVEDALASARRSCEPSDLADLRAALVESGIPEAWLQRWWTDPATVSPSLRLWSQP